MHIYVNRASSGCGADLPHGIKPGHSHDFTVAVRNLKLRVMKLEVFGGHLLSEDDH